MITKKKVWHWECDCGTNGYEDTYDDLKETLYWHKQQCDEANKKGEN